MGRKSLVAAAYSRRYGHPDSYLAYLKGCPMLEEIDLSRCPIGDAGLVSISDLPSLRRLVLAGTKVSDDGLKALRPGSLRTLDLSGTKITDAGLKYLCKPGIAERLTELNLADTAVTDNAVEYLRKMPRLKTLRLTGTTISDQGVEKLRQSLPNCRAER